MGEHFRIYGADGGSDLARQAIQAIWLAVCDAIPEARCFDLRGVSLLLNAPTGDFTSRFAVDYQAGFFACEGVDIAAKDAWEVFVLAWPDGAVSTGWRRVGKMSTQPPDVWVAGAVSLPVNPLPVLMLTPFYPLLGAASEHQARASTLRLAHLAQDARARGATTVTAISPTPAERSPEGMREAGHATA